MKCLLIVLALSVSVACGSKAAPQVQAARPQQIAPVVTLRVNAAASVSWDYTLADILAAVVTRFELAIDAGAFANTGLPATATSYLMPLPKLALGDHAAHVRACNVNECGPDNVAPLTIIPMIPPKPPRLNIVPAPVPLAPPLAVEVAQGYGLVASGILRPLSDVQLAYLAGQYVARYPDRVLELERLRTVLDAEYLKVGQ